MFKILSVFLVVFLSFSANADVFRCYDGERVVYTNFNCKGGAKVDASITIAKLAPTQDDRCRFNRRQIGVIENALAGRTSMREHWEKRKAEVEAKLQKCTNDVPESFNGKELVGQIEKATTREE